MKLLRVLCIMLACGLSVWGPQAAKAGPFSDVPQTHWAYDSVSHVAQRGVFTGYPDGTFSGRRALTRYEFAVALQRMLQEVERSERQAALRLTRNDLYLLQRLLQEFTAELAMLGADTELSTRRLASARQQALFRNAAENDRDREADAELRADPGYIEGARRAAQEWTRGEALLYVVSRGVGNTAATPGAPIRFVDDEGEEWLAEALAVGHNDEVERLIRRHGVPKGSRLPWLEQIAAPASFWLQVSQPGSRAEAGARRIHTLDIVQPEAVSPDGRVLLRLEEPTPGRAAQLRVALPERSFRVSLAGLPAGAPAASVCWGAPGSDLLFLAYRIGRADAAAGKVQVVDLRTGRVLNSEACALSARVQARG